MKRQFIYNHDAGDNVGGSKASAAAPGPYSGAGTRELTFGQKAVGLTFNPSGDDAVAKCKQMYADVIDQMNDLRALSENGDVKRMASEAITNAQTAQMWAVKALTWKA